MKVKVMISISVALVLLMGLVLLLMAAEVIPSPFDEDGRKEYSTAFVLGVHANSRSIDFENNTVLLERLDKVAKTYGFFSVVVADGDPAKQSFMNDIKEPDELTKLLNFFNGKTVRDRSRAISEYLRTYKAEIPEVDMLKALDTAARQLAERPSSDIKEIVVLGTGLSTAGFLNLVENDAHWLYSDSEEIVTILKESDNIPDLTGIHVVWCQMHDVAAPQKEFVGTQKTNLEEIWRKIVENGGGSFEIKLAPPGGDVYAEDYPFVSVIELRPPEPIVSSVAITPSAIMMNAGDMYQFSAAVEGSNNPSQEVVWSVSGNQDSETVIRSDGTLEIADDETAEEVIVRATSVSNNVKYAEVSVTISAGATAAVDITPNPDNMVVQKGEAYDFEINVTGIGDHAVKPTWELTGNKGNTAVQQSGTLTIDKKETAAELTLTIKIMINGKELAFSFPLLVLPDEVDIKFIPDEPKGTIPDNNGSPYFLYGKAQAAEDLREWAEYIRNQPGGVFLFGCTAKADGIDNARAASHKALGQRRADAVKYLLTTEYHIDEAKIIAVGLGYENPWHRDNGINGEGTWNDVAASENRRVLILSADDEYAQKVYNGTWK